SSNESKGENLWGNPLNKTLRLFSVKPSARGNFAAFPTEGYLSMHHLVSPIFHEMKAGTSVNELNFILHFTHISTTHSPHGGKQPIVKRSKLNKEFQIRQRSVRDVHRNCGRSGTNHRASDKTTGDGIDGCLFPHIG